MPMAEPMLRFDQGVSKIYPDGTRAVDALDLTIEDGEFMVFVGPSGCGKTTALRMVAGLEEISDGAILIGGAIVNDVSPKDRDVAMVFQNYALYPHMTVAQNLAFGLKLRKIEQGRDPAPGRRRPRRTLGLEDYLERKPRALSGGQRQRVAMGRAIVREPRAFLMDEPLSNLDAQLRVQMRAEIQRLQRALGVTTIYVTHDQTEAMTMGDRIAVMRDGTLQQVDTPERVYQRPGEPVRRGLHRLAGDEHGQRAGLPAGTAACIVELRRAPARDRRRCDRRSPGALAHEGRRSARDPARGPRGRSVRRRGAARDARSRPSAPCERRSARRCSSTSRSPRRRRRTLMPTGPIEPVGGASTALVARVHPESRAREGDRLRLVVDTKRLHFFDPESGLAYLP